jgi:hypothetical protein
VQETNGGECLIEEVTKKFISGEALPCRPNFGLVTEYFEWGHCSKTWEVNLVLPAIKGNPDDMDSLRSWTRRFGVLQLNATFTADPGAVDPEKKVFQDDPTLSSFLSSEEARLVYLQHHLLPFQRKYPQSKCLDMILNPHPTIVKATEGFVRQMARGGMRTDGDAAAGAAQSEAEELVRNVHAETHGSIVREYAISRLKFIPGIARGSTKGMRGQRSRLCKHRYLWYLFFSSSRHPSAHPLNPQARPARRALRPIHLLA